MPLVLFSCRLLFVFTMILTSLLWTISLATGVKTAFTSNECALAFQRLQLSWFNFDRYEEFFDATSTMTIAEAGVYTGPQNIKEYVELFHPSSPYIETFTPQRDTIHPVGFDPIALTCTFLSTGVYTLGMSPRYSIPVNVTTAIFAKITYDYNRNVIDRIHIFHSSPWQNLLFGQLLNTHAVKRFICHTTAHKCKRTHKRNGATSIAVCIRKLNALPISSNGRMDGFDLGCRVMHVVSARSNNARCPHISFFEDVDPDGQVKCQTSENIQVSDLFSNDELDLYKMEMAKSALDPEIGYKLECVDSRLWKSPLGDGSGGCNWVAKKPNERCAVEHATVACRKTCIPLCR